MSKRGPPEEEDGTICFAPFQLELRSGRLTRDHASVSLRPKTWRVLLYLAHRPGVLISKDEILDAVWPDVTVTPDTLTKSIGELRLALGDDSRTPRFIETVHRRGFRFIADAIKREEKDGIGPAADRPRGRRQRDAMPFVGRTAEVGRLEELFGEAHRGERRIAFVTGPAGIGKSALVEAFLGAREERADLRVCRGTCIDQHGAGEPYMPVLEGLEQLIQGAGADTERLTKLLRRFAPTWLVQLPWLTDDAEALRQTLPMVRPERMLREFAAFIAAFTRDVTVVMVLEDLHWSDPSTVELLSFLGHRSEAARLLVIGTYRPAEVAVQDHPLGAAVRILRDRQQCVPLPLHELAPVDVRRYLEERFPGADFAAALAPRLHDHTDGNPLFIVSVVDHMLSRGFILDTAPGWALSGDLAQLDLEVPQDIGQMVEAHLQTLSPADRELIEAASVCGVEVEVPALAGLIGGEAEVAETRCENLARARRVLRAAGRSEWPGGDATRCYAFIHELYRRVVYAGLPDRKRQQMHLRLADFLETAYGDRAADVAPLLAIHFQKGHDPLRSIHYLTLAAERARKRFANQEAFAYLEPALAAAGRLADPRQRQRQELLVRIALGPPLSEVHGYASNTVGENYRRADALCAEVGTPAEHFAIVYALCHFHALHGDLAAEEMGARLDAIATDLGTAEARVRADSALLRIAVVAGKLTAAEARMGDSLALPPQPRRGGGQSEFGPDPVIDANAHYALALWLLGHPARGRATARAATAAARALGHPFTLGAALGLAGMVEVFCGNTAEALALADEAADLCREHDFAYWHAFATAVRGRALFLGGQEREGIDDLLRARAILYDGDALVASTHVCAFLADAYRCTGSHADALAVVNEGLAAAESSLDRTYRPELWRLKGEILSTIADAKRHPGEGERQAAESCLVRALALAHQSAAGSLELRAATSLACALRASGRAGEARALLARVLKGVAAEPDGAERERACALLAEIRGESLSARPAARRRAGARRNTAKPG